MPLTDSGYLGGLGPVPRDGQETVEWNGLIAKSVCRVTQVAEALGPSTSAPSRMLQLCRDVLGPMSEGGDFAPCQRSMLIGSGVHRMMFAWTTQTETATVRR